MAAATCPQAPGWRRFRVRRAFQTEVAQRFGSVYAFATLARRGHEDITNLYAPVVNGPGDVPVFAWPPIPIDELWLEPEGGNMPPVEGLPTNAARPKRVVA